MQNSLIKMVRELLMIDGDLPYHLDYQSYPEEHPSVDDFELHYFTQTWGSTALGFGGVGGQAITTANTYVFIPQFVHQKCFVYFGAGFAYAVPYSQVLMDDVRAQRMESVSRKGKYYVKEGT